MPDVFTVLLNKDDDMLQKKKQLSFSGGGSPPSPAIYGLSIFTRSSTPLAEGHGKV